MGWKPEHGGIAEILRTKQFPDVRCLDYYDESLDKRITGMKHRERVMREMEVEECGDRTHGARNANEGKGKTLTFQMNDSEVRAD